MNTKTKIDPKKVILFWELKELLSNVPDSISWAGVKIPDLPKTVGILISQIESVPEDKRSRNIVCRANKGLLERIYLEIKNLKN